jgi:ubiquinol-cytochrome c reductase cytochrome b subunit
MLFRRHGVTPSATANPTKTDRFYPTQLAKDVGGVLLLLVIVAALAWREHGAPLDCPADPASDYPARPEWYFLSLFQMLKYFEGRLEVVGSLVVPGVAGAYLALLPFWDRGPSRALRRRILYLLPLVLMAFGVVALTALSVRADKRDEAFQKARNQATARSAACLDLAKKGIPPDGPLAMLRRDPETRGAALFQEHCVACHRLNDLGPPLDKAKAPDLTGWGTVDWAMGMLDDPDAPHRFGHSPYKGEMISFTKPPADPKRAKTFKPMSEADRRAVATFLANEAAEVKDQNHDAQGAKIIAARCTTCHLFRGQTDDDDSAGPELAGWASTAWTHAQLANPGSKTTYRPAAMEEDRKGHMPRFDDKLEPEDVTLLAAWVRKKARGEK